MKKLFDNLVKLYQIKRKSSPYKFKVLYINPAKSKIEKATQILFILKTQILEVIEKEATTLSTYEFDENNFSYDFSRLKKIINQEIGSEAYIKNTFEFDENNFSYDFSRLKINQEIDSQTYIKKKLEYLENEYHGIGKIINIIVIIYTYITILKMTKLSEKAITSFADYLSSTKEAHTSGFWYRGQNRSEFSLMPSICRKEDEILHSIKASTNYYIVDFNYLYEEYETVPNFSKKSKTVQSILDKYKKYINPSYTGKSAIHGQYELVSYIQHSISLSPFIDFSKNRFIALSFALENFDNIVNYCSFDSAIFKLTVPGDDIIVDSIIASGRINNSKVYLFRKKTDLYDLISSDVFINMILGKIISKVHLIDIPQNDRMKYQKGTFMLIDDVIIFNDLVLLTPTIEGNVLSDKIEKLLIPREFKTAILAELLTKHREFHKIYLYDPYLFLREPI